MVLNVDFIKYLYLLMKEDSSYIIPSIALLGGFQHCCCRVYRGLKTE